MNARLHTPEIIVVLPAGIYLLGKVYDDITEKISRKDVISKTMELERTTEENEVEGIWSTRNGMNAEKFKFRFYYG